MLTLASEFQKILSSQHDEIIKLNNVLNASSASLMWKDREGIYLGRNNHATKKMQETGFEKNDTTNETIIGQCDFQIFPAAAAKAIRENDILAMESNSEIVKEESILCPNGNYVIHLSSKTPLKDKNGNTTGIICSAIDISQLRKTDTNPELILRTMNNNIKKLHQASDDLNKHPARFTPREIEVLQLLIQGKTAKMMARILFISSRTVESYIENIKFKMGVNSKYALIEKIIDFLKIAKYHP